MINDDLNLRLLSIFHCIVGGFILFFLSMPLIILALGFVDIISSESILKVIVISSELMVESGGDMLPRFLGTIVLGVVIIFYLMIFGVAVSMLVSGIFLSRRKHYLFSLIVACIECIFIPFGTILGIFTAIVLSRDSIKGLYYSSPKEGPSVPAE
jgi:hypothetical protein